MKYLVLAFLSLPAFAKDAPYERFSLWLDAIERPFSKARNEKQAAENLLQEKLSRIGAFNLQALARVYSDLDPEFIKIRDDYKEIEDGLGAMDKWSTLNNKKKLEDARDDFEKLMGKWVKKDRAGKIRSFLKKFRWPTEREDLDLVTSRLEKMLREVDATTYDMGTLEEGNGLHEFRRDLRWFLIEARVMAGLVQFRQPDGSCPVPAYSRIISDPIARSKYSALENRIPVNPSCGISRCLFLALVKTVEEVGGIKDQAESMIGNSDSDTVPAPLRGKAESIYNAFRRNGAATALADELERCR